MHVSRHDHFSLYVADLDRSERWYRDVLGLEPRHMEAWWSETARFLGYGEAMVALFLRPADSPYQSEGMPIANHQAFRVTAEELAAFRERLTERGIPFRRMDHTISRSLYFQDPDGYWIELTTYERAL